jgi:hypothetical protein
MADNIDEAAARAEDREEGIVRAKAILTEFVDATLSTAEAMLEEHKQRAAQRVDGLAESLRCAAQCLERSDNRAIARYAARAADQVGEFSLGIRNRGWNQIIADAEDLARRRPALFMLGATLAGFLAARVLSLPTDRPRTPSSDTLKGSDLSPHRGETDEITAAVSRLVTPPAAAGPETR